METGTAMNAPRRIAVVGGNLTAGAAVTTLRGEGFDGEIVVVGAEPHPPYERPPLSKEYLRGEAAREDALLHDASWYDDNDVELRLSTTVERIDPRGRAVVLEGGEWIAYDAVLVATGGRNKPLSIPGHDLEGVFTLRTIEDCDRIREAAARGAKAAVVGNGFIGCEVTASLRRLSVDVEVVDSSRAPLVRVVGPEVASVIEGLHRDHGVTYHFGQRGARFEGGQRLERVVTDHGVTVECDFAVAGIGIEPRTEVVAGSGVAVDNGILVDEFCRTNVEGVFAAGDVANHYHPVFGRHLRVEHWDNALKQGAAAARNMMGRPTVFDDPHWFWSDQYDANLQYMGFAAEWDEFVVRGSLQDRDFAGFYLKDGVVRAAVAMNRGKEVRRSATLIRDRVPVDAADLADQDVDLRRLAKQRTVA